MADRVPPEMNPQWFQLEQVFANAPVGLVLLDRDLRYLRVNRALADMVRMEREEMIGRTVAELFPGHIATVAPPMQKVFETGEAQYNVERDMKFEEGQLSLLSSYIPIRDAGGVVSAICLVVFETTDLMKADLEIRRARDLAEAASKSKDHFLAVLSHELRTPLTPVLATVSDLQNRPGLPADVQQDLALIRRNVELESRLIDDLLDLTRITQGKVVVHHELTDAHEILRHAVEICHEDVESKGLQLSIELAATKLQLNGDPARLQQVFWNLLKNAIKFTPEGGSVRVRTSNYNNSFAVEVADSGMGIEADVLPRLFTAFEQGRPRVTREFGGLGLGLTISKALVDLHGGTISASSPGLGRGAVFTVTIPLPESPLLPHAPAIPAARTSEDKGRLLLVEDHPDTLRVMARLIRQMGYTVDTATNVADAVAKGLAVKYAVLVTDIGLPDGTGMDILQKIGPMPAIAVSGFGMPDDLEKSAEAGFSKHLTKPVDVNELAQTIASVAASGRGRGLR